MGRRGQPGLHRDQRDFLQLPPHPPSHAEVFFFFRVSIPLFELHCQENVLEIRMLYRGILDLKSNHTKGWKNWNLFFHWQDNPMQINKASGI